jgi:hypothetical protein
MLTELNLAYLPITLTGQSYDPHYEKTSFHYLSRISYAHNDLTASMVVKHYELQDFWDL